MSGVKNPYTPHIADETKDRYCQHYSKAMGNIQYFQEQLPLARAKKNRRPKAVIVGIMRGQYTSQSNFFGFPIFFDSTLFENVATRYISKKQHTRTHIDKIYSVALDIVDAVSK